MKFTKPTSIKLFIGATAAAFLFFGCGRQEITSPTWEQQTMGTSCHITLAGSVQEAKLTRLREKIDAELEKVNRLMSTWQPDTEISRFNAFKSTEPFPVSPEFAAVVLRALEIADATGGAFDPTVKPLVDHWGFGSRRISNIEQEISNEELNRILAAVGWQKISVQESALVKAQPDVQIDLSAIAKGYGVDAVAEVIRNAGFTNFLVEIGGEVVTSGAKQNDAPWVVGIQHPDIGQGVFHTLELSGRAMATSGDYRNFRKRADGIRYSHIIDPVTGMPAETDVASVSVLADSCMDADVAATALFVMGSERGFQWLSALRELEGENHPEFDVLFILHSTNQSFTARATPGFPKKYYE